ncbi:MAG: CRTAC1 family protein [Acidobacteriota bacterium]
MPCATHKPILAGLLTAAHLLGSACLLAAQSPRSSAPAVRFVESSSRAGLDFRHQHGGTGRKFLIETMGAGGGFLDFDNDGWIDVYLVQSGTHEPRGRSGNRLYRNRGDGTFAPVPSSAGASDSGYGMGCTFADYDNDGWTDIYITNFGPNVLLRNRGDGTFEDVSQKAGVADSRWSVSAAFADVNRDGWLDLYVANYLDFDYAKHVECGDKDDPSYCHPDVYQAAPNSFYLNQGDGTFREASALHGLRPLNPSAGKSLGVIFFDMEGDGDSDLYVANDSTANYLFENQGQGRFRDVSVLSGTAYNLDGKTEAGMGIAAGDINLDGRPDLIVTHLDFETNTLYLNQGQGFFSDHTDRFGLGGPSKSRVGFGINLEDFDNDGDLDLFVANGHVIDNIARENPSLSHAQPDQIFLNDGTGRFRDASQQAGEYFRKLTVSRGSATGDIDNDGDLDLLVTGNNGPAVLLEHQGTGHSWIRFQLRGRHCNRDGIGARLRLQAGDLRLQREVRSAASYASQSDMRLHFGLGPHQKVGRVEIRWPCGKKQVVTDLAANRLHRLEEPK